LWLPYIDGEPCRPLGNELGLSGAQTYRRVVAELNQLPDNTWLSHTYCNRWSGILHVDGKYISVKGYTKKIPWIWSVDFLQHDFPVGILAPSENVESFLKFFRLLKTMGYPLQVVICDDVSPLRIAVKQYYPKAKIQLCQTHYVENIRQTLRVRTESKNQQFFHHLVDQVFPIDLNSTAREAALFQLYQHFGQYNPVIQKVLVDIHKRSPELFCYQSIAHCPRTNNILESFNSHLNARLKSVKKFQSFRSAERFLNAYLIRRRTKPFTDCRGYFTKFNGHAPLENTIRKGLSYPTIPGFQETEM
jgi:transposase-like protein